MLVAVVTFPGSNCDQDALYVVGHALVATAHSVWHKETALPSGTDLVILPGGFSHGDALRSGALARFSPIMGDVGRHAARGGFVFGICNGFQILLESGLLPGGTLENASRTFVCREVRVRVTAERASLMGDLPAGTVLRMPVAHHQGRYFASAELVKRLEDEDRVAFRYEGDNPNGSLGNIAGILNEGRNVLGMMPHPERATERVLGSADGERPFRSIARAIASGHGRS